MQKQSFENIIDLSCNLHLIPSYVAADVMKRILDWVTIEGHTETDEYVLRQLRYASLFLVK